MAGCKRNWAQSSAQTTQNLLRVNDQNLVLWAIDENMGTNLQAFYKHFYIGCLKTQKQQLHFVKIKNKLIFFLIIILFLIRAGHVQIGQGASQYGQGAAPSEICLAGTLIYITISTWGYQILPEIMFTKKLLPYCNKLSVQIYLKIDI